MWHEQIVLRHSKYGCYVGRQYSGHPRVATVSGGATDLMRFSCVSRRSFSDESGRFHQLL